MAPGRDCTNDCPRCQAHVFIWKMGQMGVPAPPPGSRTMACTFDSFPTKGLQRMCSLTRTSQAEVVLGLLPQAGQPQGVEARRKRLQMSSTSACDLLRRSQQASMHLLGEREKNSPFCIYVAALSTRAVLPASWSTGKLKEHILNRNTHYRMKNPE